MLSKHTLCNSHDNIGKCNRAIYYYPQNSQADPQTNTNELKAFLDENHENFITIIIPSGDNVIKSIVIPANAVLEFENGGRLFVEEGETLEINGGINAGRRQIFAGDGKICGRPCIDVVLPEWFGACSVSGADDSLAIQKAFDFAASKIIVNTSFAFGEYSLPIDMGSGVFYLRNGLKATSFVQVKGNNATLLSLEKFPDNEFAIDITIMEEMPWNISASILIEGIQFGDFSNGIRIFTNDADRSSVILKRCKFSKIGLNYYKNDLANLEYCDPAFEYGVAIYLDSQSSLNQISECVFNQCHRTLYIKKGDYVVLENSWITTRPIVQGKDIIKLRYSPIVNHGYLIIRDCMGIPGNRGDAGNFKWYNPPVYKSGNKIDYYPGHPEPVDDPSIIWANQSENAWIANFNWLLCDNMRFGGEYGGFCAVNNFASGHKGSSRYITIINSMIRHEFNEPTIRLFAVPNNITIRDNNYLELYMMGKFSYECKEYKYKLKLIEFAPSLSVDEVDNLLALSSRAITIRLDNNHCEPRLGRIWNQETLIPLQLQQYLINDLNQPYKNN